MFYLELFLLVVPHHAEALGCKALLGPYCLGVLGHPVHGGPHLPQVQGDAWEYQEGRDLDTGQFVELKIVSHVGDRRLRADLRTRGSRWVS